MMNQKRNDKSRKNKLGFLDDHTLDYYRRVHETLNSEIDGDEKELFLNNVFSQLQTEAIKVSQNQTASRFIENLLAEAKPVHISQLLTEFSKDWSTVSTDRFASHVLQNLITLSPKYVGKTMEDEDMSTELIKEFILGYCTYVMEDVKVAMLDTYGSHVLRALLEVLGGVDVSREVIRSRVSSYQKKDENPLPKKDNPPAEYDACFKKLVKKIFSACNYSGHLMDPNSSPVYQTILLVLKTRSPESCHKYVKKFLRRSGLVTTHDGEEESAPQAGLPPLVRNEVGSYLVEQIVAINLGGNNQRKVYTSIFKGRLLNFAIDRVANYILQKLIDDVTDKDLFEEVFDELGSYVEDILAMHHIGLLSKMASGCIRVHTRQERFLTILMDAFHCASPEERQIAIGPLLLSLSTYEVFYKTEAKNSDNTTESNEPTSPETTQLSSINYHGTVLLQNLLKFGQTKVVAASLLALKPIELKILSCDRSGSHVIDVFCESETVGDKTRDLLLQKMKGLLLDIACDRIGSRMLEGVWRNCSVRQRSAIAEELARHEDKLRGSQFGHFIHRNFDIQRFKLCKSDWTYEQGATAKKRKLFKEFLDDSETLSKKKSKLYEQPLEKSVSMATKKKHDLHQSPSKKRARKEKPNAADDDIGDRSDENALLGELSEEEEASKLLDLLVKKHSQKTSHSEKKKHKRADEKNDNGVAEKAKKKKWKSK